LIANINCRSVLRRLQIACRLLASLSDDLEADLLTLGQRAHARLLDRGNVHEHILGAVIRLNKAEAFLSIEELHSSDRHRSSLSRFSLNARTLIAPAATLQVLGVHLRRSPKPGAGQQGEPKTRLRAAR
jgi:hypothetical protein